MGTPRLTTRRHVLVKTSSGGCAVQNLATTDLFEHKVGPSVPTHVLMWDGGEVLKYLCAACGMDSFDNDPNDDYRK